MVFRSLLIVCFSFGLVNQANANCPYEIGQTVSPVPAKEAYERISAFNVIKDEYETTAEFERRKQSFLNIVSPLLIAGRTVPKGFIEYDADNKRLIVKDVFASPTSLGAEVSKRLRPDSETIDAENDIAYDISPEDIGALLHIIYEKHVEREFNRTSWIMDENIPYPDYPEITQELGYLYMAPATAKAIRDDLRVAFYVTPKTPFVYHHAPFVIDRRKRGYQFKIIFADIHCAMITDSNGIVLKTINPNRSGVMMTNPAPFSQPLEPYLNRRTVVEGTPIPMANATPAPQPNLEPVESNIAMSQPFAEITSPPPPVVTVAEPEIPTPRVKPTPPPAELRKCKSEDPDKYCTGGHF